MRRAIILICLGALALPVSALASASQGTPEQIAWVRHAASRFVTAELKRDGAEACAVMSAPMRAVRHGGSCERRWRAKFTALLGRDGERARLHAQLQQISSAVVLIHGGSARIVLSTPLVDGHSNLVWSESCWMLEG